MKKSFAQEQAALIDNFQFENVKRPWIPYLQDDDLYMSQSVTLVQHIVHLCCQNSCCDLEEETVTGLALPFAGWLKEINSTNR